MEKEALALLLALQHFEVYLGGSCNPVVVYTDHNPLVFLGRMCNSNQRLMRWSLILQEYNLDIQHRKGAENVVADALSTFTFTFNHLADAFIQSDVQMRRTIEAIRPSREQQYTSALKSLS